MKNRLSYIILSVAAFFVIGAVYGQDNAGAPVFESFDYEADRVTEKIIYSPGEGSEPLSTPGKSTVVVAKDSASFARPPVQKTIKPGEAPKNTSKPKGAEDDSILSFNFLYYIIQKYKLQDIVD
jgi:hypothetical protein